MYQQTIIIGNLGKDPEMRYLPSGKPVTDFTVAVNRRWGGQNPGEETTWFRVSCFGQLAETTNQYLKKGRQVMVIADQIKASAWVGQDGEARATLELVARDVRFLGGRGDEGGMEGGGYTRDEEDLPF